MSAKVGLVGHYNTVLRRRQTEHSKTVKVMSKVRVMSMFRAMSVGWSLSCCSIACHEPISRATEQPILQ